MKNAISSIGHLKTVIIEEASCIFHVFINAEFTKKILFANRIFHKKRI